MRCRPSGKRNRRGGKLAYTFLEVVVAVLVVGAVLGSLYRGVAFSFDVTRSERENLRATQVLLRRLEGIRLLNWDQVSDPSYNPTNFTDSYLPPTVSNPNPPAFYTGIVSVATATLSPGSTNYADRMKVVTVNVKWKSGRVLRSRNVSTFVSKNGIQNYIYSANLPVTTNTP